MDREAQPSRGVAAHGDEHAVRLVDTAMEVAAAHPEDGLPVAAALRAIELIDPLGHWEMFSDAERRD
jgi:hypothetical protein